MKNSELIVVRCVNDEAFLFFKTLVRLNIV